MKIFSIDNHIHVKKDFGLKFSFDFENRPVTGTASFVFQPMTAQELWQWVKYSYGEELGLGSSDEDYVQPSIEEEQLFQARMQQTENALSLTEAVGSEDKVWNEPTLTMQK